VVRSLVLLTVAAFLLLPLAAIVQRQPSNLGVGEVRLTGTDALAAVARTLGATVIDVLLTPPSTRSLQRSLSAGGLGQRRSILVSAHA
jgi:hypothetical protein